MVKIKTKLKCYRTEPRALSINAKDELEIDVLWDDEAKTFSITTPPPKLENGYYVVLLPEEVLSNARIKKVESERLTHSQFIKENEIPAVLMCLDSNHGFTPYHFGYTSNPRVYSNCLFAERQQMLCDEEVIGRIYDSLPEAFNNSQTATAAHSASSKKNKDSPQSNADLFSSLKNTFLAEKNGGRVPIMPTHTETTNPYPLEGLNATVNSVKTYEDVKSKKAVNDATNEYTVNYGGSVYTIAITKFTDGNNRFELFDESGKAIRLNSTHKKTLAPIVHALCEQAIQTNIANHMKEHGVSKPIETNEAHPAAFRPG